MKIKMKIMTMVKGMKDGKELAALHHLLCMIPHLHYIGFPSHVAPIIKHHPNIDDILRVNRGGRWLVERPEKCSDHQHHFFYHRIGHDRQQQQQQQCNNDDEDDWFGSDVEMTHDDGSPSVLLWPRILQRSYDQSATWNGLAGGASCIMPAMEKDASAMFFLLGEGLVLLNSERDGHCMVDEQLYFCHYTERVVVPSEPSHKMVKRWPSLVC
jgi:hypothetical protein